MNLADQTEEQFQASYRLHHPIGSGGAGEVWLATQVSLNRPVVVKFIRPEMMADELSQRRFEREARVLAHLAHPHIVPVYEYGTRAGRAYLVMEYVAGGSLSTLLSQPQPPSDVPVLRIALQIVDGLDCLHREGIVHRDIKPGNILITDSGLAKLADFGLARHAADRTVTTAGPVLGTPHYVAPEVLLGGDPSAKSDIFSLGVLLYQLLARRLPWDDSGDITTLIARRVNAPPDPLERYRGDLPRALTALVNRLLMADPERRPGSRELKETLEEVSEQSFGLRRGPSEDANTPVNRESSIPVGAPPVLPRSTGSAPRPPAPSRPSGGAGSMPPALARIGWPAAVVLGLLTGACAWLASTRMTEPFRLVGHVEARPRAGGLEVLYRTNRPCATVVRVTVAGASVSSTVTPSEPASTEHRAVLAELPEGKTAELALQFPDGTSAALSAPVPVLVVKPLAAERLPRRVSVELTTALRASLKVDVTPERGPDAGTTRAAASAPGNAHHLEIDGLDPRQTYELRARVVLDTGEERPLATLSLVSPVVQLVTLARTIRDAHLLTALDSIEKSRRTPAEPAHQEPVQKLVLTAGYPAWRDALARVVPRAQLDRELTAAEKRDVYEGLQDLRLIDRYCESHGLPLRTGVEKLMPPDLAWADAPLWALGSPDAWTPFPRGDALMPPTEDHVNIWTEGAPLQETTSVTLPVPPLAGIQRAQLVLKVHQNRASGYVLESPAFPFPLLLVPADATVFKPEPAIMYHAVPVSWLRPGPTAVTLRLRMLPGFYKNVRSEGTVKFSDLRANCPVPEELALYLYGGGASSPENEAR